MPQLFNDILACLPDLPQVCAISHVARALDQHQDVHAVWLGGSFARGEADRFSDVVCGLRSAGMISMPGRSPTGPSCSAKPQSATSCCDSPRHLSAPSDSQPGNDHRFLCPVAGPSSVQRRPAHHQL